AGGGRLRARRAGGRLVRGRRPGTERRGRRVTRLRDRGGRPALPVLPAAGGRDAVRPYDRPDERAAARGLGARRRGRTKTPSRVQRTGRRVPAVAPGAFDPLASTR